MFRCLGRPMNTRVYIGRYYGRINLEFGKGKFECSGGMGLKVRQRNVRYRV